MAAPAWTVSPFVFDREQMKLTRDDRAVSLGSRGQHSLAATPTQRRRRGQRILLDAASPGTAVEEANLTVQIAALRRALGGRSDEHKWIVTWPRVGYRLIWPQAVEAATESRPPAAAMVALRKPQPQTYVGRHRWRNSTFVYKGRAVDVRDVCAQARWVIARMDAGLSLCMRAVELPIPT